MTVAAAAQMEGISEATQYNWRNQAKAEGKSVPGSNQKNSGQWPARHSPQRTVLFYPVFKYQTRHPYKLPHIIDHQHSAGGDGVPITWAPEKHEVQLSCLLISGKLF